MVFSTEVFVPDPEQHYIKIKMKVTGCVDTIKRDFPVKAYIKLKSNSLHQIFSTVKIAT